MISDSVTPEVALLGCLCLDPEIADEVFPALQVDEIEGEEMRSAYMACRDIFDRLGRLDVALIPREHRALVAGCAQGVPSSKYWRSYLEAITADTTRRRVQALALQMLAKDLTNDELLDLNARLCDILQPLQSAERETDMTQAAATWLKAQSQPTKYITTGFSKFDNLMFWAPGDFILIGGRPSAGKTAFSLQIALNMARQGYKVGYFSFETHPAKLFDRLVSNAGGIPLEKIKKHQVDTSTGEVAQMLDELSRLPLHLISASGKGVPWIKATAAKNKFDVVMIDYLQLIPCTVGKSRYEEVTKISMDLHGLAQQSGRLVVALCQLNRNSADDAPRLQDLRESGQLEQDADAVILLHNPQNGDYTAAVAKSKESNLGRAHFLFDGPTQRFFEN